MKGERGHNPLKRTANVLGIGWDDIQERSLVKNVKVNKYHYGVN